MPDIDYDFAELFPIGELADRLPRPPRGHHATSKIYSWLNLASNPAKKTLRSVLIGHNRYCCDRWVREFIDAGKPGTIPARSPAKRDAARDRAKRALAEAGI